MGSLVYFSELSAPPADPGTYPAYPTKRNLQTLGASHLSGNAGVDGPFFSFPLCLFSPSFPPPSPLEPNRLAWAIGVVIAQFPLALGHSGLRSLPAAGFYTFTLSC